jgi:aspartate/methionine/tyrosine aminotransferase
MEAGHNQYAAMTGLPPLKERIAEKLPRFTARSMTPAAKCW